MKSKSRVGYLWVNIILMKMAGVSICCFPDNGGKPPSIDLFWRFPCQPPAFTTSQWSWPVPHKIDTKPSRIVQLGKNLVDITQKSSEFMKHHKRNKLWQSQKGARQRNIVQWKIHARLPTLFLDTLVSLAPTPEHIREGSKKRIFTFSRPWLLRPRTPPPP